MAQCPPKYAPGSACPNSHSILVTAWNHSTSVFKRCDLLILFFIKNLCIIKYMCVLRLVLRCCLVARKENLTIVSNGLTSRSKNLDPTGNPSGKSTRPVSISDLGNCRYWRKMISDFRAHYHPPFFWLCSFTPTWILFFFFFLFLLRLSPFKPLNALYSKFERLKISGRTSVRLKLGVPGWGDPPQSSPPKFWSFKPLQLDESNFPNG